uniref:Putative RNA-binding protein 18 n=1 Tax=Anthurium amnicola TaxID=1678845 RepID=A0A1D1XUC3_9ARAE
MQEARLAKTKMNGRLACGRPLVVHFANERDFMETNASKTTSDPKKLSTGSSSSSQMSRGAMIAAIRNKLRSLEGESDSTKKPRLSEREAEGIISHQSDGCSMSRR